MTETSSIQLGAFRLERRIGRGGMAEVWKGRHLESGTDIALKVITTRRAKSPWYIERFRQEVQALAHLNHPGIISVFEHGLISDAAARQSGGAFVKGSPFFVMEYASAGTLADRARIRSWPELRNLLTSILDALAFAHARDVIHRDLKPENVLCFAEPDGKTRVKLADFGVAQAMHPQDNPAAAGETATAGTPMYMAPEQSRGEWRIFGPWTDLYALGCLTYTLVSGAAPFTSESVIQLALDHIQSSRPPLRPQFAVPQKLEWWIHTLMRPRSEERFQRAGAAAKALEEVALSTFTTTFEAPTESPEANNAVDTQARTGLEETKVWEGAAAKGFKAPDSRARTDPLPDRDLGDTEETHFKHVTTVLHNNADLDTPSAANEDSFGRRRLWRPSLPEHWQRSWTPRRRDIAGIGLGLFGLRAPPMVDREEERDTLWQQLRRAQQTGEPRVVILSGPEGVGKSRLAQWLIQRAHEIGATDSMHASHEKIFGPSDGLGGMLERFFRAWDMKRGELYEHLQVVLTRYFGWNAPDFDGDAEGDARALTEIIAPSAREGTHAAGPRYQFGDKEDRFRLVQRVVGRAADKHTTICWMEDVHWGASTLDFVEFAVRSGSNAPILYVLGVDPDELETEFDAARRLEMLEEHPSSEIVDVEPFTHDTHTLLVDSLLPLTPELEDRVVRKTLGQPILAQQLIGAWVQQGLLEPGPLGYKPRPEARDSMIMDPDRVWMGRLRDILDRYDGDERVDGLRSLEVAAALGHAVDVDEWHMACGLLEVRVPDGLISSLVDVGIVRRSETSLKLVHRLFQESLEQSARTEARWRDAKAACAEALQYLYPDRSREFARRRATYLLAAESFDEAASSLLEAAEFAERRGFSNLALETLDHRDAVLDKLDVPADDKRRIRGDAARMRPTLQLGDFDEAARLMRHALDVSSSEGWTEIHGYSLRMKSGLARIYGDLDEALEAALEGLALLENVGPSANRGWLEISVGEVYWSQNDYDAARDHYVAARREFQRSDEPYPALKALTMVAFTHIYQRDFEVAEPMARETLEQARRLGDAWSEGEAWNQLGEIARLRGRFSEARDFYLRLLKTTRRRDPRNRLIVDFNLSLVETVVAPEDAKKRQEHLVRDLPEAGVQGYLPCVHWGIVATSAIDGDWKRWERYYRRATEDLPDNPEHLSDIAWSASVAAEITRLHSDTPDRIERIDTEARALRERSGQAEFPSTFYAEIRQRF